MSKKILSTFVLSCLLILGLASSAQAKIISGERLIIAADEVIDDDLFIAGQTIEIAGTVNGDIYAAAENIDFTGQVSGDLMAAGNIINVSGQIGEDLQLFGSEISVAEASVASSLVAAGATVNIADSVVVEQSVLIAGANNRFAGQTARHLLMAGQTNRISGVVKRDLLVGGEVIDVTETASVSGKIERREMTGEWHQGQEWLKTARTSRWPKTLAHSFRFFSFLIWAILLLALWPKLFKNLAARIEAQPGKSLLIGLLAMTLILPVFIFLILTIIGIPLAFVFVIWSILLMGFAKAFVAVWLGQKAFALLQPKPKQKNLIWQFLLGYLLIFVVSLLPGLGWLWRFAVMLMGTGAVYLSILDKKK